jgi:hypothetical protein
MSSAPPWRRLLVFCAALFVALGSAGGAADEPVTDADTLALRAVIKAQLAALKSSDAQGAFAFASDAIRGKFGSAENFLAMVRDNYAVVMAPASIVFLQPERAHGDILQAVQMSDTEGRLWVALYFMQRQTDSSWRINGCVLQRLQGSST